jgi:hypothetical protein
MQSGIPPGIWFDQLIAAIDQAKNSSLDGIDYDPKCGVWKSKKGF